MHRRPPKPERAALTVIAGNASGQAPARRRGQDDCAQQRQKLPVAKLKRRRASAIRTGGVPCAASTPITSTDHWRQRPSRELADPAPASAIAEADCRSRLGQSEPVLPRRRSGWCLIWTEHACRRPRLPDDGEWPKLPRLARVRRASADYEVRTAFHSAALMGRLLLAREPAG